MSGGRDGRGFGSILSKELLYRKTMDIAKTVNSKVLEANAWHHRSDALSSVVVFGSLFGSSMGYSYLDGIGGLVVSFMILRAGTLIGWDSLKDLVDKNEDNQEIIQEIEQIVDELALESKLEIRRCKYIYIYVLLPFFSYKKKN